MNLIIKRVHHFSSNLARSYLKDKNRDAICFVSQRLKWDHNQLYIKSTSVANGLKSMLLQENDHILLSLAPSNQMEMLTLKIAAAHLQINLHNSIADTPQKLIEELNENIIKAFIFCSYNKIGKQSVIEAIYRIMPRLRQGIVGSSISDSDFQNLKFLVQTDNYPYASVIHFKNVIRFGLAGSHNLDFGCKENPKNQLADPQSINRPIIITNPLDDFVFEAAILNCMVNGRILYVVQQEQFAKIAQNFDYEVDYVGTSEVPIQENTRVFIPKESMLFKSHNNRFQI